MRRAIQISHTSLCESGIRRVAASARAESGALSPPLQKSIRPNSENTRAPWPSLDSNVLKLAPDAGTPAYRSAPHNIEAEQSLLGAILVNNDAFYRVSDFLEPKHFFEPIHQTIYETAGSLIRMGKVATPVTLKTFLPADTDIGGMTVGQYLARLAAEATTIINAQDYGRTIYELSLRRDLIRIGEDMVNVAFDAPVDFAPRAQIEDAERRLYELAESGRYDGGFQRFAQALTVAVDMAAKAFQRDGKLSGIATGLRDLDIKMGGLQPSDLIIVAGRPGMGKTALATNIAYNVAKAHRAEVQADGTMKSVNGGIVGFFSCEMSAEQLATRILAEQTGIRVEHDPPRRHHRRRLREDPRLLDRACSRCRSMSTRPAAFRFRN